MYVYARRRNEILDELLFPLIYIFILKEMFELRKCSSYVRLVTGTSYRRAASGRAFRGRCAPLAVRQSQYGQSKKMVFVY